MSDPRHGQIATLASLLLYGLTVLDFDITLAQVVVTIVSALAVQAIADWWTSRDRVSGAKSALISSLSLCLLLRTDALVLAAVASSVAVLSKFLIRVPLGVARGRHGKHVFNPTNIAIVALMLATDRVWVSPGQWGAQAMLAFFFACAGLLVVNRAARSDVTLAFMTGYAALIVGRSLWLGEPLSIPLHRLESGAFLLFSFFMISDPKTTPDSRAGRLLFAALVACGAAYVQLRLFRTNGFLWALAAASPLVPVLDRLLPSRPYCWPQRPAGGSEDPPLRTLAPAFVNAFWRKPIMRFTVFTLAALLALTASASSAEAFCGFYVAKADGKLFNKASHVVLVRDGDRTVITMSNDFRGDPKEFAMVIPVPTAIQREQIHVGDRAVLDHLDAFTAPRLVEYFDPDPCRVEADRFRMFERALPMAAAAPARAQVGAKSLGVTVDASYTVGEYDILILSATQSTGLETWLTTNGYRIPQGASSVLATYLKQNMRFFVAKVNLAEQARLGFANLRPIQIAYESPKFMLPIRLGMVNADGPQELFVYTLSRKGRVESTNYRTIKLRTDVEIPTYVKDPKVFASMYQAMFDQHVKRENMSAVFQEYAWDMGWCDPCAADPLSSSELRQLGVWWVGRGAIAVPRSPVAQDVFVTRLHVRYDRAHFPEDLVFQDTGDRTNFQGRYVLRQRWTGPARCDEAVAYEKQLRERHEREAQALASLTGWSVDEITRRMQKDGALLPEPADAPWWKQLWR
jgi:Na+-translocating ferredoxin:NAD+ oxidoreductase RnfD subunit